MHDWIWHLKSVIHNSIWSLCSIFVYVTVWLNFVLTKFGVFRCFSLSFLCYCITSNQLVCSLLGDDVWVLALKIPRFNEQAFITIYRICVIRMCVIVTSKKEKNVHHCLVHVNYAYLRCISFEIFNSCAIRCVKVFICAPFTSTCWKCLSFHFTKNTCWKCINDAVMWAIVVDCRILGHLGLNCGIWALIPVRRWKMLQLLV